MKTIQRTSIVRVFTWIVLAATLLWVDYLTGPAIQERTLFFLVVVVAAWFDGWLGLAFAILMPLCRILLFGLRRDAGWATQDAMINAAIHMVGLSVLAYFVRRTRIQMTEIHVLRGLLPICCFCKKIRDQQERWQPIEGYIAKHSEAQFSHGICPECLQKHYADEAHPLEAGSATQG
jgi:hypothetical protein